MGPVTGLVGGVKSWTYGGVNTQRSSYNEWDYYYDVAPTSWTGSGTGATFEVGVYQGKVRYVKVNRQGSGYASGDVLTLNDYMVYTMYFFFYHYIYNIDFPHDLIITIIYTFSCFCYCIK